MNDAETLPSPIFVTDRGYRMNCNGYATAVVAVAGDANDWAVYIGGADPKLREREAVAWVARNGDKFPIELAAAFFPDLAELSWSYRR